MNSIVAKVVFNSNRHCFAKLPKSLACRCSTDRVNVIKIEGSTSCLYTSWAGDISNDGRSHLGDVVEVNGLLASKLGFLNEEEVTVTVLPAACDCVSASVVPVSVDDWEILEMNASTVESNLLNQVRVVSVGQVFPIWVQKSTCIFVTIGSLEPSFNVCLLQPNTELVISPKTRFPVDQIQNFGKPPTIQVPVGNDSDLAVRQNCTEDSSTSFTDGNNDDGSSRPVDGGFLSYLRSFWSRSDEEKNSVSKHCGATDQALQEEYSASFRVLDLEDFLESDNGTAPDSTEDPDIFDVSLQPYNIFIDQESIPSLSTSSYDRLPNSFLAQISKIQGPGEKREALKQKAQLKFSERPTLKFREKLQESDSNEESVEAVPDRFVIRVFVLKSHLSNMCGRNLCLRRLKVEIPRGHVLVHRKLRQILNLEKTSSVQIDALRQLNDVLPDEICIYRLFQMPDGFTDDLLLLAAKQWAELVSRSFCPLVLNNGSYFRCFIKEGFSGEFFVTFGSHLEKLSERCFCLFAPKLVERMKLKAPTASFSKLHSLPEVDGGNFSFPTTTFENLHVNAAIKNAAVEYLDTCFGHNSVTRQTTGQSPGLTNGGLLLCGVRGSGKTVLGSAIGRLASGAPNYAFIDFVDCRMLKGKKPETICQFFEQKFDELSSRQPSLLFIDDLDHIAASSNGPEQDMSGLAAYYARVAESIRDLMQREALDGSSVGVVASAVSYTSIHPVLVSARGSHVFTQIIEIKPPNQEDRVEIIRHLIRSRKEIASDCLDSLDLHAVASQTEGFVAKDLELIVNRAIHASLLCTKSSLSNKLTLSERDFEMALADFKPAALRSLTLVEPDELSWADVGGLHDVRSTLIQTLQWPSKYPKLFSSCPLRLRSGLLLYGAPGTGKTHLAAVIAKEFRLNFISVKGPELFNKYIGASEQAVRDTFARAQSAKPCVLFFDEFDSLAPRRGHDNTGVTDRVVNQLLTQLDGVESLEGVFVLAATSRPDLIDPALLRPGRLDKALHCPVPSKLERLEILNALSRKMKFSNDVDLQVIADRCTDFTGADFKALLYNAQLNAIHDRTSKLVSQEESSESQCADAMLWEPDSSSDKSSLSVILVNHDHLLHACRDVQPSVSASERLRYHQIYESFVSSRGGHFVLDPTENVGQRVTLA